jgi:hypothetical protein
MYFNSINIELLYAYITVCGTYILVYVGHI